MYATNLPRSHAGPLIVLEVGTLLFLPAAHTRRLVRVITSSSSSPPTAPPRRTAWPFGRPLLASAEGLAEVSLEEPAVISGRVKVKKGRASDEAVRRSLATLSSAPTSATGLGDGLGDGLGQDSRAVVGERRVRCSLDSVSPNNEAKAHAEAAAGRRGGGASSHALSLLIVATPEGLEALLGTAVRIYRFSFDFFLKAWGPASPSNSLCRSVRERMEAVSTERGKLRGGGGCEV